MRSELVVSARNEVYVGLGASAVTIRVLRPSIVTVAFFDRRAEALLRRTNQRRRKV